MFSETFTFKLWFSLNVTKYHAHANQQAQLQLCVLLFTFLDTLEDMTLNVHLAQAFHDFCSAR
jgi:hypothetical protein